jgi:hypothetical protein
VENNRVYPQAHCPKEAPCQKFRLTCDEAIIFPLMASRRTAHPFNALGLEVWYSLRDSQQFSVSFSAFLSLKGTSRVASLGMGCRCQSAPKLDKG